MGKCIAYTSSQPLQLSDLSHSLSQSNLSLLSGDLSDSSIMLNSKV